MSNKEKVDKLLVEICQLILAPPVGLEPTTCGLTVGVYSICTVFLFFVMLNFYIFYGYLRNFSCYTVLGLFVVCDPKVTQKERVSEDTANRPPTGRGGN